MRIIYAGTPDFAVPALQAVHAAGYEIVQVLSQPDRPAGRGRMLQASPVKQKAIELDIPIWQPNTLKTAEAENYLEALDADLMLVIAYGLILPQSILDLPTYGCWNIHASLLPRWRGAAPIQRAIEAGDEYTGNCIMQMSAGLDTGPVIAGSKRKITADDTAASLHDSLATDGAKLLNECLKQLQIQQKPLAATQQIDTYATYASKLDKAEAELDLTASAELLERRIRAFNPWPMCWMELAGKRTRILQADVVPEHHPRQHLSTGKISHDNDSLFIGCGNGVLAIQQLQPAGSKPMPVKAWLNAYAKNL